MKHLTLIIATLAIITAPGCGKDKTEDQDCYIIKITQSAGGEYILSHDANGRLQSVAYGNSSVTNFTYSNNSIISLTTGNGGYYRKTVYTTGSNGLVSQSRTEYNTSGTDWADRTYEYNGTQLIKSILTKAGGFRSDRSYTWNNGNMIKETISNSTGSSQVIDYEYYTGKNYRQGDIQHWDITVNGIEIVRPANLLKKITSTYTENNVSSTEISNYSYAFGSDGKIVSMTETEGVNGLNPFTYNYLYQCN